MSGGLQTADERLRIMLTLDVAHCLQETELAWRLLRAVDGCNDGQKVVYACEHPVAQHTLMPMNALVSVVGCRSTAQPRRMRSERPIATPITTTARRTNRRPSRRASPAPP